MSFLRSLANSFSSLLFSSGGETAPMDAAGSAPSPAAVVRERVAVKLRGYFDLAKEEMDKAVRAEEWGLPDDATAHYRNAMRVMLEAQAARVPDAVSSSGWCPAELERLAARGGRSGCTRRRSPSGRRRSRSGSECLVREVLKDNLLYSHCSLCYPLESATAAVVPKKVIVCGLLAA
ncbi:Mosaic virus helicase domain-binding protein [Zea mays]|uniref:Mosaic virus helicase domain-binding protein n=1 Tax=Zea mays TaxID=4577 RepID=A0A1D6LKD2_MAIZE|nr:Mosaic virus helicase domain-binding protein [Zea mays]